MSLIKKLIQRLLDSRTTPEQAGHSAMPTTTEIASQSFAGPFSSWGPVASGTASEDGYIYAAGAVATSGSNSEFRLDNGQFGSYITSTWGTQGLLLPVMKGQFWRLYASNRKDVVIRLYRLVGGYNLLIRRALSCLRALSNFSPRSSFRTNPNGSAIKLCQTIQPSGLFTHLKAHPVNTSHRLTGMSLFTLVAMNGRKSGMETGASLSPQRVLPTSAFKCLSLKAPKLGMSFRTPWPTELKKRPLSLFQQSERNALTGGALC